jgi:hypothetical protein
MKTEGCSVYQHRRADNGSIFYVGKASNKYRKDKTQNRNTRWHEIVQEANGFVSEIVVDNVDEEFSLLAECEYIDKLKRIGVSICNLTSGGQGRSGWNPSDETRRIWSEQRKGRPNPRKGTRKPPVKKTPEEILETKKIANEKRSASLKGRTPWNKGVNWENVSLRGRVPHNKGVMVVGSKRWKIQQNKLLKAKKDES